MFSAAHDLAIGRVFVRTARVLSAAVLVVAAVTLVLGWWLDIPAVRSPLPGPATMTANTAAMLLLTAVALLLRVGEQSARRQWAATALALTSAVFAAVTLSQDALGWDAGIDRLLAEAKRMAPATSGANMLAALAVALLHGKRGWATVLAHSAAIGVATIAGIALVGYAYDVRALSAVRPYGAMSPQTAICLVALAVAIVFARPRRGLGAMLSVDTVGGSLLRRLLPAVLLLVPLVGWWCQRGVTAGYYDASFGVALFAVASVVIITAVAWMIAARLHRSELEQRTDEQSLAATVETSLDGIVSIDRDGRIIAMNAAAERLVGGHRGEMLGRSLADVMIPERFREAHRRGMVRFLETGDARVLGRRIELPVLRRDGAELPCEIAIVATERRGERTFTAFLRDLSIVREAEENRRLAYDLALENQRIEAASRIKNDFVANVSHELRTPLNAIIGFSEILVDERLGPLTPVQLQSIDNVLTSGRHLLTLINEMLDLAKVEAGRLEITPVTTRVATIVDEVLTTIRATAAAKQLAITSTIPPEADEITVDPVRLRQILYNYLSNAVKFTPEAGTIAVAATREDDDIRITVTDSGAGISPRDQTRLFAAFVQVGAGRASGTGTGLGLVLSRRLAEAMHGTVGVVSNPGAGSTFWVTLPRTPPPPATTRAESAVDAS
jgi:PAS domain S-box-containing protein